MVESVDHRSGAGKRRPEPEKKPEPSQAQETPKAEAAPEREPRKEARPGPSGPLPAPTFIEVTQMLFLQAMIALGEGQEPDAADSGADLEMAKHHIGLLELLQEKTKGNLGEMESKYLSECLHQTRLAFVAAARIASQA